jgi:hypothetical protein
MSVMKSLSAITTWVVSTLIGFEDHALLPVVVQLVGFVFIGLASLVFNGVFDSLLGMKEKIEEESKKALSDEQLLTQRGDDSMSLLKTK